jgi:precorrin-4 methylase
MTADLVTRLRGWLDEDVPIGVVMNEAADRVEQLEAALRDIYGCSAQAHVRRIALAALAAAMTSDLYAKGPHVHFDERT